ncbi:MAG: hypothetical protein A2042_10010 [Candidatus Schekmanbacteria bacterium GWA2_38_11]|uniref:Uncharacterized protein n=1 Tax=Candidatus Schekmanbacteria bacterium GWA2_38_11 TaxID=1817876 RepID=A0A1F7RCV3_9BACT|nr:MAG: hypothetical protein A2042_10010 [Candidatus Schekmanbacteria bacterium GWA2_38_11]
MDFALIEKIFCDIKKSNLVSYVIPSLMGEPLLHPRFFEFLNLAKKNNIKTHLITNGSLLSSDEKIEKLFSSNLWELVLSYQIPQENLFYMRRAGNLDWDTYRKIMINIISKKFEKRANTVIEIHLLDTIDHSVRGMNFISNPEEMLTVINEWKPIAEKIAKKFPLKSKIYEYPLAEIKKRIKNNIEYMTKFEILPEVYLVLKKVVLYGNYLVPEGVSVREKSKGECFAPFKSLAILWNGDCTFCCQDFDGELVVGNIRENSLEEIWYGEKLNKIRKEMKRYILSNKFCQRCYGDYYDIHGNRIDLVKKKSLYLKLNHSCLKILKVYQEDGLKGIFSKVIQKVSRNKKLYE